MTALTESLVAGLGVAVGGSGAEDDATGGASGYGGGIVGDAAQVGERVRSDSFEFVVGEGGVHGDVAEDCQGIAPGGGEAVGGYQDALSAGDGANLAAEELHFVGDLAGVAGGCAFGQHGGGQVGYAGPVRGVVG